MKRDWQFAALIFFAAVAAAGLRLPRLNLRPFHGDEAVHAYKLNGILHGAVYRYDPYEFHGPTLNFATLPLIRLRGADDYAELDAAAFRIVPVIFGLGLIALLPLVSDGLGRGATLCAGALTAISPLMVFCSRHYVQEMLLVFFTFALIACGWRYLQDRRLVWALLAGICAGLMHATKETCLIALGALLLALVASRLLWRKTERTGKPTRSAVRMWAVLPAVLVAIAVSVTLFSSFFTNAQGPLDSLRAYSVYIARGAGDTVHTHPWYYYLQMLLFTHYAPGPVWSEALIVALAAVGLVAVYRRADLGSGRPRFIGFIASYTVLMVVIYSALPYKTPWSMLGFVHGMILLAGVGVAALLRRARTAWSLLSTAAVLALAAMQLCAQAYRTNLDPRFVADPRNPYVYAHPLHGVEMLGSFVERLADVHPDGRRMFVRVVMPNAWPVPWYLRRLERVGYWERPPVVADAPVVVTASDAAWDARAVLGGGYQSFRYSLRPDVSLIVFVETELYARFREQELRRANSENEPSPG